MLAGFAVTAAFAGLFVMAGTGPEQAAPDPALPGRYAVIFAVVTIDNPATGDQLQTDIYYPAANDGGVEANTPHPTIVFAPAFIAQPSYYVNRGQHLASRGYIVAIPRFPNEDLEVRASDIQQVFTYLEAENAAPGSRFFGRIDAARFGLAGHSLGGVGTLMVAARDPRVKVGVSLDPIDPSGVLNKVSRPLAAAGGNPLRAILSTMLRGRGLALCGAVTHASSAPAWDYAAEEPAIRIPLAVIGGENGCTQFSTYADYSALYPGIGSQHKALYVLPDGWHCDFMYTDNALVRNACYLTCGGSYSESRAQLIERYLTAWFEYYLAGRTEYDAYLYGAEVAADVAAERIVAQWRTA
jgi:pimeloyl-ACP methyl ester carboxylesterase